jgi:CheY-like chemotaxis protein
VAALDRLSGVAAIQDILVVDDDLDDLRLVQKILQEHGDFQVRLAQGGPEGLVAIQTKPPQLLILDLLMPELDGFTLLETIREEPFWRDIPVIILSAGDLTEEQQSRLNEFSLNLLHKEGLKGADLLKSVEDELKRIEAGKMKEHNP